MDFICRGSFFNVQHMPKRLNPSGTRPFYHKPFYRFLNAPHKDFRLENLYFFKKPLHAFTLNGQQMSHPQS